ncbi:MAG: hypothetical protein H0W12_08865 [Chitinophagaceae bacterium]|nr:hypothetical protein [Chitinophagaceae bacterium]
MAGKKVVLFSLLFCLLFSACKKDPVVGSHDYKTLGTSAHDLLSANPYSVLQIEINYMPGYAVDAASINNLVNFLQILLNKPSGILVFQKQIEASGKATISISDIVNLERQKRTLFTLDNIIAIHILVTDDYYTDPLILGTSYWNTSFCIFGQVIKNNSGGVGQVSTTRLTTTILEHEFGHLLGLVNQGSPMQVDHIDPANGAHCINKNCLMYYAAETSTMGMFSAIPTLDANCMNDLKANGGK